MFDFFEECCPAGVGVALKFVDDVLVFWCEEVSVASLTFEVFGNGLLFVRSNLVHFAWRRNDVFAIDDFVDWEHAGFDGEFAVFDGSAWFASPAAWAGCEYVHECGAFDF